MNTRTQLQKGIEEVLERHTTMKLENGFYQGEIYVEHNDEFEKESLTKLSDADHKQEAFDELISSFLDQSIYHEEVELLRIIKKHWYEEYFGSYDENKDAIEDIARDMVQWTFPEDHYLSQNVKVNIIVDTGDGNTDFGCNNLSNYYASGLDEESDEDFLEEESSLLWLSRQQGYTREQLLDAVRRGNYHDSKLLKSIDVESQNTTTSMNALAFFVKMSVHDFIKLNDEKCNLILDATTNCGLYDRWNGAGGTLEIELEKDVTIPAEYIRAHIEDTKGYGIDSIYGIVSSFWKETVKEMTPSKSSTPS